MKNAFEFEVQYLLGRGHVNAMGEQESVANIAAMEGVVDYINIQEAVKAVISNKGAPGIDGITTEEIKKVMREQWPKIKQDLLEGKYCPQPVRRVEIPKPDGNGVRQLGIPTVMDRIIQQAIHQELVPVFEPIFSQSSHGFRPNRRAHQAVLQAQKYIQDGCEWVVDIDLEKFFDRVNHDMLMARVARRVKDKKILLLIRRFLEAGVMEEGLVKPTEESTPQGGPLSPLLSNIMLDDFDKELEKRGLRFARYADDWAPRRNVNNISGFIEDEGRPLEVDLQGLTSNRLVTNDPQWGLREANKEKGSLKLSGMCRRDERK